MSVFPYASDASTFSSQVDYVFRVRRVTAPSPLTIDPTPLDVTCRFDGGTVAAVTCSGPDHAPVQARVGDLTAASDGDAGSLVRVFAGLRSDPAFFDRQGAAATIASGRTRFTGLNAFRGANVLAIVVEMDPRVAIGATLDAGVAAVDASPEAGEGGVRAPAGLPILAVAAETVQRLP
jgi:hypothetical protein